MWKKHHFTMQNLIIFLKFLYDLNTKSYYTSFSRSSGDRAESFSISATFSSSSLLSSSYFACLCLFRYRRLFKKLLTVVPKSNLVLLYFARAASKIHTQRQWLVDYVYAWNYNVKSERKTWLTLEGLASWFVQSRSPYCCILAGSNLACPTSIIAFQQNWPWK